MLNCSIYYLKIAVLLQ